MNLFGSKKAQVVLEYGVLAMCIVAALLLTMHYIKRGMAGRLRQAADTISDQHYDPRAIDTATVTFTDDGIAFTQSYRVQEGRVLGVETTTYTDSEVSQKTGHEVLEPYGNNLFN